MKIFSSYYTVDKKSYFRVVIKYVIFKRSSNNHLYINKDRSTQISDLRSSLFNRSMIMIKLELPGVYMHVLLFCFERSKDGGRDILYAQFLMLIRE